MKGGQINRRSCGSRGGANRWMLSHVVEGVMGATVQLPPGPKGHLLLGNVADFPDDPLGLFTRCTRDYGDFVPLRFGPKLVIHLAHPDLIEFVWATSGPGSPHRSGRGRRRPGRS